MELPKLNYDNFYKFIMSGGILFSIVGSLTASAHILLIPNWTLITWISFYFFFAMSVAGFLMIFFSGKKWYDNQKLLDEKLRLEIDLMKMNKIIAGIKVSVMNEKKTIPRNRRTYEPFFKEKNSDIFVGFENEDIPEAET